MKRKRIPWYRRFLDSSLFLVVIWIFTGFALGTLVLLFPVRAWVNHVRENNLSGAAEKVGVILMILVLAAVSFIISLRLFQWHLRKKKTRITAAAIAIPFVLAVAALSLFMNPDLVNRGASTDEFSRQFTIGPYPTESKIRELKLQGYTGIISLLHPAVVPFEPSLLADEEKYAKQNGIELVKAPMLPWIGDNTASLKKIEDLANTGKGKYYVHCYLGKDRVNVVKNLIVKLGKGSEVDMQMAATHRTFEKMQRFERGEIYRLDEQVYMTPYPTEEEFLSFFLAGGLKTVVNLLDSTEAENKPWIDKERTELERSGVRFVQLTIPENATTAQIEPVIDSLLRLQRPVAVHRWNTISPATKNFRKLYSQKTGKQPLNLATNASETY
ncbi:MAG: hypothetical protein K0Q66_672 [Chitinophagaceae bacterium]|jgi:protein tyrosine phosphatase (PTP) superfamily phosphohydrolase (DUF442 family)|nr:hypothetical protein [Chitinophagaceae bacterium]